MLSASNLDGPAFNTRSKTAQWTSSEETTSQSDHVAPDVIDTPSTTPRPKSLTTDRLKALPKCIRQTHSVNESQNGCQMEKHLNTKLILDLVTDSNQKFLDFVIPKSWKYTVLLEVHDKLGHQGATQTYCLIKCQYYWKGMKKDIRKYINQSALCHREKAKVQAYPLQMTEITE